jgi:ribosome-associated protein
MDIRKLQRAIVDGLEDVKAQNVVVFNTEHLTPLFERVIVASGASNRQTKALASSVRETVKSRGMDVLRTEGEENGEWIIVDCGAAVVHVMQPAIRDYYHLEELWGEKPVRMKIDHAPVRLVKAEPQRTVREVRAVREEAPQKAAPRKAVPAKPAGKPTGKTAARKPAPAKAAPRRAASAPASAARQPLAQAAPGRKRALAGPATPSPRQPAAAKRPARAGTKAPVKTITRGGPKSAPKGAPKTASRGAGGAGKGGAKSAAKGVKKR